MPHSAAPSGAVLVTGCSTGIGKATAARLARSGWTVYATARKPETLEDLKATGCRTLALDVNDEASMQAAVGVVEHAHGAVGVLVNNAGYSQSGAVESVPLSKVRAEFETNVFGLIRMCQLVLPGMRRQGRGRIINMGSMGGKLTFPGGGIYHASKYAVEALSDALRFEVRGFGVDVVLIQPGLIRSQFSATVGAAIDAVQAGAGPYQAFNTAVAEASRDAYEQGLLAKLGGGPERVAATIEKVLRSARPRARYAVTPSARLMMTQRAVMTDRAWDRFLRSNFPTPGSAA